MRYKFENCQKEWEKSRLSDVKFNCLMENPDNQFSSGYIHQFFRWDSEIYQSVIDSD